MNEAVEKILKNGGVGVLPTDTIYGVVGSALSRVAVERIYALRRRNRGKPMIVLIGSLSDLKKFAVRSTPEVKKVLKKFWPGKTSVILPCASRKFSYLHRGTKTLAFRLPAVALATAGRPAPFDIRKLLRETGPLVAPSANVQGKPPAKTIREARKYFGERVDFYLDAGRLAGRRSSLLSITGDTIKKLR
ncbi:MAG: threonylcarbamoyl-AMP synthase [Candidatus Liptonbacteria bacterium]|nr:threonylcarbamoyl-AMP synthase [Candidatus Liptonbacteria bacterium]